MVKLDENGVIGQKWTYWTKMNKFDQNGHIWPNSQIGQNWPNWTKMAKLDKNGQIEQKWPNKKKKPNWTKMAKLDKSGQIFYFGFRVFLLKPNKKTDGIFGISIEGGVQSESYRAGFKKSITLGLNFLAPTFLLQVLHIQMKWVMATASSPIHPRRQLKMHIHFFVI